MGLTPDQSTASTTKPSSALSTCHVKHSEECYSTSRDMMYKFQNLFSATKKSLCMVKVSAQELISHIECLGATKPTFSDAGKTQLQHLLPALENIEACTTDKIMSAIKDYCSFFNYQMLGHIINKFGTEQDKKNLQNYEEKFNEYAECCVIECPAEFGKLHKDHAYLIMTLDDSFDNCTVSHLNIFITNLCKILNIESAELRLCRVNSGSIKITFQLPQYAQQAIFGIPLSSDAEEALADLHVVELTCGNYKFIRQSVNEEKRNIYIPGVCEKVANIKIEESITHIMETSTELEGTSSDTNLSRRRFGASPSYSTSNSAAPAVIERIQKAKDCVALVECVYADITSGCIDGIGEKLEEIKRTANELAELSEQRANVIEEVEEQYIQESEEIQRKIRVLGCQLEEKKKYKCDLEASLSGKQAKLAEEQTTLTASEREVGDAEGKLRHARKKRKKRRRFGGFAGAVLGTFVAPGIGTLIGAATGGAVGVAGGADFVGAARRKVDRCKEQVQRTESDLSSTKKELSDIETQIASLLQQCGNLENQKLEYSDKAIKMKEVVLFFHRASMYWKEFKQLSELSADHMALMQNIIHKANEKEDLSWLTNSASKETFLDAWVIMETKFANINIHTIASSETCHYSATVCATPYFLDEIKVVPFDSHGLEHKINGYDIAIKILENSIPEGQTVHLKIGAALNAPFKSSSGKHPVSPILWLCPEEEFLLSKPMEIILPHILTDVTSEDIKEFGIQVSKATHESFSQYEYLFKPLESQDIKFESNEAGSYAVIHITHCCFYCLEANNQDQMTPEKAQAMAKKVGYTMHCIEHLQSPYGDSPLTKVIHFRVSFSLIKCIKAVEDQYPVRNDQGDLVYRIHQSQSFKMNDLCVRLKHSTDNNVTVALSNDGIIHAHQVDFWEKGYDIALLRTWHYSKQYPPNIEMTAQIFGQIQLQRASILSISFEGCAPECAPKFQIILPAVESQPRIPPAPRPPVIPLLVAGSSTSNTQPAEVDEVLKNTDIPTLYGQLKNCSTKWRTIGMHLRFLPGELDNIGANQSAKGVEDYLLTLLTEWMEWIPGDDRGSTQVATLGALKDALDKAGYGRTAHSLSLTREQSSDSKRVHTSTTRNGSADESMSKRPRVDDKTEL